MPNDHDISEAESLDLFWMQRALELADNFELGLPVLRSIAATT